MKNLTFPFVRITAPKETGHRSQEIPSCYPADILRRLARQANEKSRFTPAREELRRRANGSGE
jgi:hypothetical protein